MKKLKVLFISSLFPNDEQPVRGLYNLHQIKHLANLCEVKVVAPYYWFPLLKTGNKGGCLANIPLFETIEGLEVYHPKAFYIPKVMRGIYGWYYYRSLTVLTEKLRKDFNFDCIYTNWLYPDSYGAMLLAKFFNVPYVAMGLGTDVNEYLFNRKLTKKIMDVIINSSMTFTVSNDLRKKIMLKGIDSDRLDVLYDGVDKALFSPREKIDACKALDLDPERKRIVYVGSLEKWKGPQYLIKAARALKDKDNPVDLRIIGDGPFRKNLENIVEQEGISREVVFQGNILQEQLPDWLNASDVFCLPSLTEGVPNVILEAFSCGIPVVATKVGGIPEIMDIDEVGVLIQPENVDELTGALEKVLSGEYDRNVIREHSEKFKWENNAAILHRTLVGAVKGDTNA